MRKLLTLFVITIALVSLSAMPAEAAGGQGTKAVDVCWMQGETEIKATFQELPNGIVQEFRYEPNNMHGVFMPKSEFPSEPDEGDWRSWTARYYEPCDGETDLVTDFLPAGTEYWVQLELQD